MQQSKQDQEASKARKNSESALRDLTAFKPPSRALTLITEAIAVRPKTAKWYVVRAQVYRMLGRNQLAFFDYNSALRLDPRSTKSFAL